MEGAAITYLLLTVVRLPRKKNKKLFFKLVLKIADVLFRNP